MQANKPQPQQPAEQDRARKVSDRVKRNSHYDKLQG